MSERQHCRVTLLPAQRVVEAPKGALLHDVIVGAGQRLSLPCGGQGRCGRCVVQVQSGAVRARSTSRLTPEEIAQGYTLACQAALEGDVTVYIPPQAQTLAPPPAASATEKAAAMLVPCDHARAPWVVKYHLQIDPPSLEDNTTDWDRLSRELARQYDLRGLTAGLACHQDPCRHAARRELGCHRRGGARHLERTRCSTPPGRLAPR